MSINEVFSQYEEEINLLGEYFLTLWVKVKVLGKVCGLFWWGFGPLVWARCSAPGKGGEVGEAGLFLDLSKKARHHMA